MKVQNSFEEHVYKVIDPPNKDLLVYVVESVWCNESTPLKSSSAIISSEFEAANA